MALAAQPNDIAHKLRASQRQFKTKCTIEIEKLKIGNERARHVRLMRGLYTNFTSLVLGCFV